MPQNISPPWVPSAEVVFNLIPELSAERTRAAARIKVLSEISREILLTEPPSRPPLFPMAVSKYMHPLVPSPSQRDSRHIPAPAPPSKESNTKGFVPTPIYGSSNDLLGYDNVAVASFDQLSAPRDKSPDDSGVKKFVRELSHMTSAKLSGC